MLFMEIEDVFSSLQEIQALLEKDGFLWRLSADEDNEKEPEDAATTAVVLKSMSFSADAEPEEIRKWEEEVPDMPEEAEKEEEAGFQEEEERLHPSKNAVVFYFDLYKKKTYVRTLIFQKELISDAEKYRLIGYCEAPMC